MKQIQEDQELKEIETRKSATVVQFVHPQIQAQRNKVQKVNILNVPNFSPCLQKCRHYIPTKLTTLNMPGPCSQ